MDGSGMLAHVGRKLRDVDEVGEEVGHWALPSLGKTVPDKLFTRSAEATKIRPRQIAIGRYLLGLQTIQVLLFR
jgi:hypothetical protein